MNINLISHYDHFPNHHPVPFEPCIDMYNDSYVYQGTEGSCALLIEPRSIQPNVYEWMEQNYKRFKYVFTHDSKLLDCCDNAKLILWGGGCGGISQYPIVEKTKNVSMVSSDKTMCELHVARIELSRMLKDNPYVDVMGTVDCGSYVTPDRIYPEYRFAIAYENYIDNHWFTEKICNCFANKVIPIYLGAKYIGEYFNVNGIIQAGDNTHIMRVIEDISQYGFNRYYESKQEAIEDNYNRVQKYINFEYWFFNEYGGLLDDLYSQTQGIQ